MSAILDRAAAVPRDHAWFDRNWRAAARTVRKVVYQCSPRGEADDVLSKTMARCWRSRETFVEGGDFESWACQIGQNLSLDAWRYRVKACRRLDLALPLDAPVPGLEGQTYAESRIDPVDDFARLEDAESVASMLRECQSALPADTYRMVLLAVMDVPYDEIARSEAVPIGTVRSRLHRARKRARALPIFAGVAA